VASRRRPSLLPNDQINLTDVDSRIMPVAGGGFEQAYNAQAALASGPMLLTEQLLRVQPARHDSYSAFGRGVAAAATPGAWSRSSTDWI